MIGKYKTSFLKYIGLAWILLLEAVNSNSSLQEIIHLEESVELTIESKGTFRLDGDRILLGVSGIAIILISAAALAGLCATKKKNHTPDGILFRKFYVIFQLKLEKNSE